MTKYIVSIFLGLSLMTSSLSFGSEGSQLRCFNLFATQTAEKRKTSAPYYAEVLDAINAKHNQFLFNERVLDLTNPDLKNLTLVENIKSRYYARKLKKVLINLYYMDQFSNPKAKAKIYNLEQIATQIEKLTFIMDDSQLKNISVNDRIAFKQVQHSLLTHGLADFLFTKNIQVSSVEKNKIKEKILAPFKKVYLRWLMSPIMMPRLDGAVIPYDVIENVIWNGYENSKKQLEPYLKTSQGKYAFNVFSSSYNWIFTGVIILSTTVWVHTTTIETMAAYDRGIANAEAMLLPVLNNAKNLAEKDMSAEFRSDTLKISIEMFQKKFQREPTAEEIEMIKELIIAREFKS
jgi:hypothetical protein